MKLFDLFFLIIQKTLPKKLLTKIFGKVASCRGWSAYLLKHTFKFAYKINMAEAAYKELKLYPDLNGLFTRRLAPQYRPQPIDSSIFSSPADGRLAQLGKIENLEQKIKNFKAFYKKAMKDKKLNAYRRVSLQFDNQVVCTKK